MAYELYYRIPFTNDKYHEVVIELYKKDGAVPSSVGEYECTGLKISANAEGFTKWETIIARECSFGIRIPENDENDEPVTWETFIVTNHDEWKVIITVDGYAFFHGFLTPDEGNAPFQDPPYELVFKAADGLALLKQQPLTQYDGTSFPTYGRSLLIDVIAGALSRTGLDLPIRIYCSVLHNSMLNRGNDPKWDMFQQTEVSNRTFLKDVSSFVSCYDALVLIFKQFCTVEYYKGMWQISCIIDKQKIPSSIFYTDYAADGTGAVGTEITDNYAQVGKSSQIFPCHETQLIASRFALKFVKTIFRYNIPANLINNEKLQQLGDLIGPLSGVGYSAYELVDWTQYSGDPTALTPYAGSKNAYIKLEVDAFDTQTDRYYVIEADTAIATALGHEIRHDNDDFYCEIGDLLTISVTARLLTNQGGSDPIFLARLVLLEDGASGSSTGDWWSLNPGGGWVNNPFANFAQTTESGDESQWSTYETEAEQFPADGKLFLFLGSGGVDNLNEAHFKDIVINYTPQIRGSKFSMKGDYWLTSQDANFPDNLEEEISISDSPKRIIAGGLWFNNQLLTAGGWARYPESESKSFKELLNIGRFNHSLIRRPAIDGDFDGLFYAPENDQLNIQPLGFHKEFKMVDWSSARDFVLVPPLDMDLFTGEFKGTFVETRGGETEGDNEGDEHVFNYIFQ